MKYLVLFFFIIIIIKPTKGQQILYPDSLNYLLTNKFYLEYNLPEKRKILSFENKHFIAKLNPIKYLSAGILFFYQRVLSEQIQANCMYYTSCSGFTKSQIEINGFRGFLLGINQLNNCFDGIIYDYQVYQISLNSKVINPIEKINP